ncbi:hypothetical protein BC567DRAFT_214097 [Phyllosticta citribraziliensis]
MNSRQRTTQRARGTQTTETAVPRTKRGRESETRGPAARPERASSLHASTRRTRILSSFVDLCAVASNNVDRQVQRYFTDWTNAICCARMRKHPVAKPYSMTQPLRTSNGRADMRIHGCPGLRQSNYQQIWFIGKCVHEWIFLTPIASVL